MAKASQKGSYWSDPRRRAQAQQAMRDSWAMRRIFTVTFPNGDQVVTPRIEEVADLVKRSVHTLRVYMARHSGKVEVLHNGDHITIERKLR